MAIQYNNWREFKSDFTASVKIVGGLKFSIMKFHVVFLSNLLFNSADKFEKPLASGARALRYEYELPCFCAKSNKLMKSFAFHRQHKVLSLAQIFHLPTKYWKPTHCTIGEIHHKSCTSQIIRSNGLQQKQDKPCRETKNIYSSK